MKSLPFPFLTVNSSQPDERYEWTILPQGMANSLAFCQQYLYSIFSPYFDKDNTLLYVYMDDLIIGHLPYKRSQNPATSIQAALMW